MTLFRAFLAALLALNLSISPATLWAQESAPDATATTVAGTASVEGDEGAAAAIDYGDWERVAQRAEQAVEAGRASDQALTNLRAELDQWRVKFTDAKAENQVRITTLQTQIATLGPAPAEAKRNPQS